MQGSPCAETFRAHSLLGNIWIFIHLPDWIMMSLSVLSCFFSPHYRLFIREFVNLYFIITEEDLFFFITQTAFSSGSELFLREFMSERTTIILVVRSDQGVRSLLCKNDFIFLFILKIIINFAIIQNIWLFLLNILSLFLSVFFSFPHLEVLFSLPSAPTTCGSKKQHLISSIIQSLMELFDYLYSGLQFPPLLIPRSSDPFLGAVHSFYFKELSSLFLFSLPSGTFISIKFYQHHSRKNDDPKSELGVRIGRA